MLQGITRLFLSPCLNLNKYRIIEPLASRCSKFRFTPLDSESASLRLSHIASTEKIKIDSKVIDALITTSSGDLRRAITYLQSASRLSSSTDPPTAILPSDIQEIAGVVPDPVINDFARVLGIDIGDEMDIDLPQRQHVGFEPIKSKVKFLMREGYSATQILLQVCFLCLVPNDSHCFSIYQLHDKVIFHPTLTGRKKSACALAFAEADKALCDGADEELWVLEVGLSVHKAITP